MREHGSRRPRYPLLRYPWENVEQSLRRVAKYTPKNQATELDYINPETGDSCLPTMGFSAMMLRPGESVRPSARSSSAVFHVIEGEGRSIINGETFIWKRSDTFSAPVFARIEHTASGDESAFLVRIHDSPLQQKLGFYEERPAA
jgi:gentisate 1,2-dioxygenase